MTDRLDDELLARYLAGEAGTDDRARVEAWAGTDAERAGELDRLRTAWSLRPPAGPWDVDAAWERIRPMLDEPVVEPLRPTRRLWIRYAAAAAVLLAAAAILSRPGPNPSVYETAIGEQREIELADGSHVVLAPASRLEIRHGFGQPARDVELSGRAWFEVTHDETRPFRVYAEGAVIEDLGTEFEVIGRRGDALLVAVMSGAVNVQGAGSAPPMRLGPGDVARLPGVGEPSVRHEAPVETLMAWRGGSLSFDETPVAEVLGELARWYGVTFQLSDPAIGVKPFTATLPTANLEEALEILGTGRVLAVARDGNVVTLSPRTVP
jgi:transmembrane sensor